MAELVCCICGDPVGEQPKRIGGRVYCERHYAHVTASRRGVWSSGVIQVAALVVFVLIVEVILSSTPLVLDQNGLVLAGVVLAIIPALLWLTFFYAQDRLEPEPKGYVGGVFLLGGLLASAIGIPLLRDVFILRDVRELPMPDVADQLGISIAAAKSRLLRARLELRSRMTRHCGTLGPATLTT